ncbi:hypothetical protein PIB30_026484 [Stylosanthes scabra]|uniref:Secreted protein n=1 Tax=Stylosanthes scabra TaxID=79078 RepID=A0ABU6XC36_9FABA|nr:hypothetical protein [Stylosanthes scabra]
MSSLKFAVVAVEANLVVTVAAGLEKGVYCVSAATAAGANNIRSIRCSLSCGLGQSSGRYRYLDRDRGWDSKSLGRCWVGLV